MKQLSAEECIARILKDIDKRRMVDYSDKNSVRRYNAAMDRIIERSNYLCDNYPDKMDLFVSLLDHPDYDICSTCTAVLYGLHNATRDQQLTALASAKHLLSHPDINELDVFILTVNIERWETQLQIL